MELTLFLPLVCCLNPEELSKALSPIAQLLRHAVHCGIVRGLNGNAMLDMEAQWLQGVSWTESEVYSSSCNSRPEQSPPTRKLVLARALEYETRQKETSPIGRG